MRRARDMTTRSLTVSRWPYRMACRFVRMRSGPKWRRRHARHKRSTMRTERPRARATRLAPTRAMSGPSSHSSHGQVRPQSQRSGHGSGRTVHASPRRWRAKLLGTTRIPHAQRRPFEVLVPFSRFSEGVAPGPFRRDEGGSRRSLTCEVIATTHGPWLFDRQGPVTRNLLKVTSTTRTSNVLAGLEESSPRLGNSSHPCRASKHGAGRR